MKHARLTLLLKTSYPESINYLFAVFFLFLIFSCAAPDIAPDVEIKKCSEYASFQEKDNLHVAMEPFQEEKIVKQYFGTDLTDVGIIPILVVAENHNQTSSFLLPSDEPELFAINQDNLSIETKYSSAAFDTKRAKTTASQDIERYNAEKKKSGYAAMALTTPIILLPLIPVMASVDLGPSYKTITVEQNIISKAFKKGTISPGESESGFIYLKVPNDFNQETQLKIALKAFNMQLKQVDDFNLIFTIKKR